MGAEQEEDADIHSEGCNFQSLHWFEERGIKMRFLLFLLSAFPAAAALVPSADGLTVYDTVNNVTWLADLNLPASNRFGLPVCNGAGQQICISAGGVMHYSSADAWVAAMNAANYLGYSNWQLPTTPVIDKNCGRTGPNGGSFGYGCTLGALDSLYNALGFKSPHTAVPVPADTVGPFNNIQPYLYWSQTSAGATQGNSTFSFSTGWQGANTLPNFLYVWPMIPGRLPGTPPATGQGLQASFDKQTVYDPMADVTWLANANLAASNAFGLPACKDPLTPSLCIDSDGAMTYDSAVQFIARMNSTSYLGQRNWQMPAIDPACSGYNCDGTRNPLGNLFYDQLGLTLGMSAIPLLTSATGPFHNMQPYLYWTCGAATIQDPCSSNVPAPNFEWSYSFGSGFQGTDLMANDLYVTAYFVGTRPSTSGPEITEVANAEGDSPTIAPNTWVEIKGLNLAPAGDTRIWQASDFLNNQMPTQLDHVSATVNGKSAFVYYISPTQINVLTPPDAMSGPVQVVVTNDGTATAGFTAQAQPLSPSFFVFSGGPYIAAVHPNGSPIGPTSLFPGSTMPAKPGESIILYANGFGSTNVPVGSGSITQSGTLSPLPVVTIAGKNATVQFAGLVAPGEFQFNVMVPANIADGDQSIAATYNGITTQGGTLLTVQH
jgi:uncharacterized protein (TIGR03437 family)